MKVNRIAIIDNGVNKELINSRKLKTEIFIDENNNYSEECMDVMFFQHGTICALIIEKYCPECVFSSIRILDQDGKGNIEKIEPALEWCCQNDIKIVNLSLGTTHFKENEKLNKLINKYVYGGLIIVAAVSNIGFLTFPASFANVIGVATAESPLLYIKDYIHLGIDTIVPSVHTIKLNDKEHKTFLSNSYAAPYVSALVAQKMMENQTCNIHTLKKYVREKSHIAMVDDLYNPDWVYKAYMKNNKNDSKADYYFETITGSYDKIEHEIDTVIVWSKTELKQINIGNKNLICLGNDDIRNVHIPGFKWSLHTRVQQIVSSQYRGKGLNVPLIILDIKESLDKYFILSKFRQYFENDGYNAYVISMEPESVLYRFEYMPDIHTPLTNQNVKDFVEGEIFYKQSDLILWNVAKEQKINIYDLYPNYDMEIIFDDTEVLVYIEKNIFYKQQYDDFSDECIRRLYSMLVNCLSEEEDE